MVNSDLTNSNVTGRGDSIDSSAPERKNPALTQDAQRNLSLISGEIAKRVQLGLASPHSLEPRAQVETFLQGLAEGRFRDVDNYIDGLSKSLTRTDFAKPLIIGIPVVGFGMQEYGQIGRLIGNLARDPAVKAGRTQILFFVNRPEGMEPDATVAFLREAAGRYELPISIIEGEVPKALGRRDGPLMEEHASNGKNRAPIAFIRDVMSITAMKMWAKSGSSEAPPVYLQMDVDFEGFERGSLETLLEQFEADPDLKFLQCTSRFDDIAYPTEAIPALKLGDDLMRELPLLLKRGLNGIELSTAARRQLVCGEAIQRGIQVPQAERLESLAQKGGYGLLRMPEDELDANIRTTAVLNDGFGVECSEKVVFSWNSRRAILAMGIHGAPPISQWSVSFNALDKAREEDVVHAEYMRLRDNGRVLSAAEALRISNVTLARFPIPDSVDGLYSDPIPRLFQTLEKCGVIARGFSVQANGNGTIKVQIEEVLPESPCLNSRERSDGASTWV